MPMYRLKDVQGCVVEEIRAVQVLGNDDIELVLSVYRQFPDLVTSGCRYDEDGRQLLFTGAHLVAGWSDYVFEDPHGSGEYHVLSKRNFEDTYEESR